MHPDSFSGNTFLLLPEVTLLPDGAAAEQAVVVADGVFADIGPAAEVIRRHPESTPVRLDGHLLMPGFVDAHHHLTQTFGKALAFGEPSEIFRRVWLPLERALTDEATYLAAKLAALESLRGGFTTVVDAGTRAAVDTSAIAEATTDAGIRCVLGLICNDLDEGAPSQETTTARAESHLSRWDRHPLVYPSLAVSIPEVASAPMLRTLSRMCAEAGTVFQFHVNEHLVAVERSLHTHGRRPLEYMHSVGALGPQALAAHATLLSPDELRMLADTGTAISYNPVASAWKGNAVAPATLFSALGIRFGLGTDGTRGDGFRLLDAAEFAQRLTSGLQNGDSSCGAGWTWLEHATAAGADAVGLGAVTGAIAVGKAADFLVVDLTVPELTPSWDPTWELVRLANRDQIAAVVVGGRLRLWRGWPIDWDARELIARVDKVGREIVGGAAIRRRHPTADAHRRAAMTS